ncbi:MAG TPA: mechanosensitive ion channel family protein [Dissulfurispiraceae bacterium]|nr:mechanosensitive ion channel family protein [Dissulfurispiraceae bacterium]
MNFFDNWGIPLIFLSVWTAFILAAIPSLVNYLRKRAEQRRHAFNATLLSVLGTPLVLILLYIGLNLFIDIIPAVPEKWEKYLNISLFMLFVWAGFLFLDRLMMIVIRRYSKTIDVIASSEGVTKTLYRIILFGFAGLIILDHLKITITPFLASLGIGGLVMGLALQDTLSNFFSGIYLSFDRPIRIGDYIRLDSGEEGYVTQVGWHSTRIQTLSNNTVIVSNAKLAGSRITNFYLPDKEVPVAVNLGVPYESDLEKVESVTVGVAREVLKDTAGGVREFEPSIGYTSIGDSGIHFSVSLRAKEYADQYLIIHEFIKRLLRRYEAEGIKIMSPVRNVYIRKNAPEAERGEPGKA